MDFRAKNARAGSSFRPAPVPRRRAVDALPSSARRRTLPQAQRLPSNGSRVRGTTTCALRSAYVEAFDFDRRRDAPRGTLAATAASAASSSCVSAPLRGSRAAARNDDARLPAGAARVRVPARRGIALRRAAVNRSSSSARRCTNGRARMQACSTPLRRAASEPRQLEQARQLALRASAGSSGSAVHRPEAVGVGI